MLARFGGLAILPLIGLSFILIDPPPDPFGVEHPSLRTHWQSTNIILAQTTALGTGCSFGFNIAWYLPGLGW